MFNTINISKPTTVPDTKKGTFFTTNSLYVYEIRGSHTSKDVDVGLLGCDATWTCRWIPTF
jgi:hypothetical protein